jgi:ferredoxin
MAELIINEVVFEIKDGSAIQNTCQKAGLAFSCNTGVCGSCLINVVNGGDQLSPLTDEERDMGLDGQKRLACQCKILSGKVHITF